MGRELYCDFCRKTVNVEEAMVPLSIGDVLIGEACFNCSSTLTSALKKQVTDVQLQFDSARRSNEQTPTASVQPEGPQHVEPEFQPATAEISGGE